MVLAGVVHHEIQAHGNALFMARLRQGAEILHGAQLRLHPAEIADGVAPVAAQDGAFQQGHEMQASDAALLNVIQLFPHAPQGAGEGPGVHLHDGHVPAAVSRRVLFPPAVRFPQGFRPGLPGIIQHLHIGVKRLQIAVVQLAEQPFHLVRAAAEAGGKFHFPLWIVQHRHPPDLSQISKRAAKNGSPGQNQPHSSASAGTTCFFRDTMPLRNTWEPSSLFMLKACRTISRSPANSSSVPSLSTSVSISSTRS